MPLIGHFCFTIYTFINRIIAQNNMAEDKVKLLEKDPNPDKLKKIEVEQDWAMKQLDKSKNDGSDPNEAFCKLLLGIKNPIQIWIRGEILNNLGLDCASAYLERARELGYDGTPIVIKKNAPAINPKVLDNGYADELDGVNIKKEAVTPINLTEFPDGTFIFSTKDPVLANKIKALNERAIKEAQQQFLYTGQSDRMNTWGWNMFHTDEEDKTKMPEYDPKVLFDLIRHDTFLNFTFHNLSTGEFDKDLDMVWKSYVKGNAEYLTKMKTFETYANYEYKTSAVKYTWYNDLKTLLKESKLDEKINIIDASKVCQEAIKVVKSKKDNMTITAKIEMKNSFIDRPYSEVISEICQSGIKFEDFKGESIKPIVEKLRNINKELSVEYYQSLIHNVIAPALNETIKLNWLGGKKVTDLFCIIYAIAGKEIFV